MNIILISWFAMYLSILALRTKRLCGLSGDYAMIPDGHYDLWASLLTVM